MELYTRKSPDFSLCGLNCALCPNFHLHTEGKFQCPGCGGENFFEKHPSCAIITCSKKHNNIDFCFNCEEYPCERYLKPSEKDSFITYKNREINIKSFKENSRKYLDELSRKKNILAELLEHYNNGRMKNYFCIAVNLIPIFELEKIMEKIRNMDCDKNIEEKGNPNVIRNIFDETANTLKIEIKLRK
jgi:hypothetical protein